VRGSRLDERGVDDDVLARLRSGHGLTQQLDGGRLYIDRPMPFVAVSRMVSRRPRFEEVVYGQGSYLIAPEEPTAPARATFANVLGALADLFGAVLVVELWAGDAGAEPRLRIHVSTDDEESPTVTALINALAETDSGPSLMPAQIIGSDHAPAPPGAPALVSPEIARKTACTVIGVEIPPIFVDPETGNRLPVVSRALQRDLTTALHRALFEFAIVQTSFEVKDFRALGRRDLLEAAYVADERFVEIAEELDLLFMVTPVNSEEAWAEFDDSGFARPPNFRYRPLRSDPDVLRRSLYDVDLDAVEDPTLTALFREKRREIDRCITLLEDRDTNQFLLSSLQLYGGGDEELEELATSLLNASSARHDEDGTSAFIGADVFARRATDELDAYRRVSAIDCTVEVRDDYPGVVVSNGNLVVGAAAMIPEERCDALVQHEIGTHVVTHVNGAAQPLRQLQVGLPGYEETQEGLAILAEYLVGGLTAGRLATIAARVLAVRSVAAGAEFIETFRLLHTDWDVAPRAAFGISMRVHRSGGLTKDAIYLRGLAALLSYIAAGGDLEPLFVGKLALEHVPMIEELTLRGVLGQPPLRPRWLAHPEADQRLTSLRRGRSVIDLVEEGSR
jgi:uncharacterized protein (TIGR02421 family)